MFIFRRGSGCISVILIGVFLILSTVLLFAHDKNHAQVSPQMKKWFDGLRSGKGPCCSDADGSALADVDWEAVDGHYRVRIEGNWYNVPDEAVLEQPNLFGQTMVWPIRKNGYDSSVPAIEIRCFIVGTMT